MYCRQNLGEVFAKFCGLLRIYELYKTCFLTQIASFFCGDCLESPMGRDGDRTIRGFPTSSESMALSHYRTILMHFDAL